ncbi:uncharacterized protein BDR25DRAFT_285625 [Lindgomyces ingoldianus]|uniref:Uncharacterized protein n=1 Tax=Lindgomyces ingoldianus TaxID=673940 RepID=A0ACB6QYL1_9PLEO|nr:uncharacterized protein BDR25DRAFT_285625 [Lindgomyces ingoldianus]KAF2471170.1 hypothetical protein BDR25DRAFT_285625 [Lindgomyces ingoldianus]
MKCAEYTHIPLDDIEPDLIEFPRKITALSVSSSGITQALQAQAQMVYACTAQRDNDLNLRLAKLSQRRNELSLKISKIAAHESHMNTIIAKSSVEYSSDMQLISVVTLLFLPGTFMATLFSASFWNFQPGHQGPVVSRWGWVYFVITITLTLTVFAVWRFFSRWERMKEVPFKLETDISVLDAIDEINED